MLYYCVFNYFLYFTAIFHTDFVKNLDFLQTMLNGPKELLIRMEAYRSHHGTLEGKHLDDVWIFAPFHMQWNNIYIFFCRSIDTKRVLDPKYCKRGEPTDMGTCNKHPCPGTCIHEKNNKYYSILRVSENSKKLRRRLIRVGIIFCKFSLRVVFMSGIFWLSVSLIFVISARGWVHP